jgi:hypothetical protein
VKQNRVLSVKQEPTSTHADFGVVGFDQAKFVTYLIFPKPLRDFVDARIVGIKYDDVKFASLSVTERVPSTIRRVAKPNRGRPIAPPLAPKRTGAAKQPARQPRSPEPMQYQVHLRITTTQEKVISVSALTKRDAKRQAVALANANNKHSEGEVKVTALKVVPSK